MNLDAGLTSDKIVLGDVISPTDGDQSDADSDVEVDPQIVDRYVGKYAVEKLGMFEILVEDDCLEVVMSGDRKHALLTKSETDYHLGGGVIR